MEFILKLRQCTTREELIKLKSNIEDQTQPAFVQLMKSLETTSKSRDALKDVQDAMRVVIVLFYLSCNVSSMPGMIEERILALLANPQTPTRVNKIGQLVLRQWRDSLPKTIKDTFGTSARLQDDNIRSFLPFLGVFYDSMDCLEPNVYLLVEAMQKNYHSLRPIVWPMLLGAASHVGHVFQLVTAGKNLTPIQEINEHLATCLLKTSAQAQKTTSNKFLSTGVSTHKALEVDGTLATQFWTIMNISPLYAEEQITNMYALSSLAQWMQFLQALQEELPEETPTQSWKDIRSTAVAYCSRLLGQVELYMSLSRHHTSGDGSRLSISFVEAVLIEVANVLMLAKDFSNVHVNNQLYRAFSLVITSTRRTKHRAPAAAPTRIYKDTLSVMSDGDLGTSEVESIVTALTVHDELHSGESCHPYYSGMVALSLMSYFATVVQQHTAIGAGKPREVVSIQVLLEAWMARNFFFSYATETGFSTAFYNFCLTHHDVIARFTTFFTWVHPTCFKLLAMSPHTTAAQLQQLLPALISTKTYVDVLLRLLDLPLLTFILQMPIQPDLGNLSEICQTPFQQSLYEAVLNSSPQAYKGFWAQVPANYLPDWYGFVETIPRIPNKVLVVVRLMPILLETYFDCILSECAEEQLLPITKVLLMRYNALFTSSREYIPLRDYILAKLSIIFDKYPGLVLHSYEDIIGNIKQAQNMNTDLELRLGMMDCLTSCISNIQKMCQTPHTFTTISSKQEVLDLNRKCAIQLYEMLEIMSYEHLQHLRQAPTINEEGGETQHKDIVGGTFDDCDNGVVSDWMKGFEVPANTTMVRNLASEPTICRPDTERFLARGQAPNQHTIVRILGVLIQSVSVISLAFPYFVPRTAMLLGNIKKYVTSEPMSSRVDWALTLLGSHTATSYVLQPCPIPFMHTTTDVTKSFLNLISVKNPLQMQEHLQTVFNTSYGVEWFKPKDDDAT